MDCDCALQPKVFYTGYYKNHRMLYFFIYLLSISGDYERQEETRHVTKILYMQMKDSSMSWFQTGGTI